MLFTPFNSPYTVEIRFEWVRDQMQPTRLVRHGKHAVMESSLWKHVVSGIIGSGHDVNVHTSLEDNQSRSSRHQDQFIHTILAICPPTGDDLWQQLTANLPQSETTSHPQPAFLRCFPQWRFEPGISPRKSHRCNKKRIEGVPRG